MKRNLKIVFGILVLTIGILVVGCKSTSTKENVERGENMAEVIYTCSMHSGIEKKEPGNCPECGMKLIEKESEMEHSKEGHMH